MSKKPTDTLAKALGGGDGDKLSKLIDKCSRAIDTFRVAVEEVGHDNQRLRREIAEVNDRLRKIEERDKTAGHVPDRWRALVTNDAPVTFQ